MATKHYVLIDGHSGYVWGEADAQSPIEACQIVDAHVGGDPREYDEVNRLNDQSGYIVYETPADWTPVEDGQSGVEIDRVDSLCSKVAEVTYRTIKD